MKRDSLFWISFALVLGIMFCSVMALAYYTGRMIDPDPSTVIPSETELTQHVAYTLGVMEGARQEAAKHCPCDYRRFLGAPCR